MKNLRKILLEVIILGALTLIILISGIASMCLDEWSATSNGMPVCDRWLYFPAAFYILLTIVQASIFQHRKANSGYGSLLGVSIAKFVAVFFMEAIIDFALEPIAPFISDNDAVYLVLVIVFLVCLVASLVMEIIGLKKLQKK